MITRENCTLELLESLLKGAFMDYEREDSHILVDGRLRLWLEANDAYITLLALFRREPGIPELDALRSANMVNEKYKVPKVYVMDDDTVVAELSMLVGAGIPEKSFIDAIRLMNEFTPNIEELRRIIA